MNKSQSEDLSKVEPLTAKAYQLYKRLEFLKKNFEYSNTYSLEDAKNYKNDQDPTQLENETFKQDNQNTSEQEMQTLSKEQNQEFSEHNKSKDDKGMQALSKPVNLLNISQDEDLSERGPLTAKEYQLYKWLEFLKQNLEYSTSNSVNDTEIDNEDKAPTLNPELYNKLEFLKRNLEPSTSESGNNIKILKESQTTGSELYKPLEIQNKNKNSTTTSANDKENEVQNLSESSIISKLYKKYEFLKIMFEHSPTTSENNTETENEGEVQIVMTPDLFKQLSFLKKNVDCSTTSSVSDIDFGNVDQAPTKHQNETAEHEMHETPEHGTEAESKQKDHSFLVHDKSKHEKDNLALGKPNNNASLEQKNPALTKQNDEFMSEKYSDRPSRKRRAVDTDCYIDDTLKITENRHMCFFRDILPSLEKLDDDQTLTFQSRVLEIINEIRQPVHDGSLDGFLPTPMILQSSCQTRNNASFNQTSQINPHLSNELSSNDHEPQNG